jgi:hypothetical protein
MVGVVSLPCAQPSSLSHTAGFLPVTTMTCLAYCPGLQWAPQGNCGNKGANRGTILSMV